MASLNYAIKSVRGPCCRPLTDLMLQTPDRFNGELSGGNVLGGKCPGGKDGGGGGGDRGKMPRGEKS